MASPPASWIDSDLAEAMAGSGLRGRRTWVISPTPLSPAARRLLETLPTVVRVADLGSLTDPRGSGSSPDTLFFLGARSDLPIRLLLSAARSGTIRWIAFLDRGRIAVEPIWNPRVVSLWARLRRKVERSGVSEVLGPIFGPSSAAFRTLLSLRSELAPHARGGGAGSIVMVNASLGPGGAERQIVNTLRGLSASGRKDLTLLCDSLNPVRRDDFYLAALSGAEIRIRELPRCVPGGFPIPAYLQERLFRALAPLPDDLAGGIAPLLRIFLARRPEVVHAWQDETNIKAGLAAALAGVPRIVLACRNTIPAQFGYYQPYMKPAYEALAEVPGITLLNNSVRGAEDYADWIGIPRDRVRVVRNGLDFSRLRRPEAPELAAFRGAHGIPEGAPVIGSVFRFHEEKRPELWFEAARRISKRVPLAHFLICGNGPLKPGFEERVRAAGLAGRFHLIGETADISLPLSAMSVFLLTSKHEGTPNVLLESQWLGVPVVTTDAGGSADAIEPGRTGIVARSDEPEALAESVCRLLADSDLREEFGRRGPESARSRFGMERMIRETIEIYGN